MGKTRQSSKPEKTTETVDDNLGVDLDTIWEKLQDKLEAWIQNSLPAIVKKQVEITVSSTEFQASLADSLQFELAKINDSFKELQATQDSFHEIQNSFNELQTSIQVLESAKVEILQQIDDLEQYTRRTNIRIYGIPESTDEDSEEDTDSKAINFFSKELGIDVAPNEICRSHRVGKISRSNTKPRAIIVRLTNHNKKVMILRKRKLLKINKRPFNVHEDLTIKRRKILSFLNNDDIEGLIYKVWTIDGVVCFRPSSHTSTVERCTSIQQCQNLVNKYRRRLAPVPDPLNS